MNRKWQEIQLLSQQMIDVLVSLGISLDEKSCRETGDSLPDGKKLQPDWQTLTELETKRSQLIRSFVTSSEEASLSLDIQQHLFSLRTVNQQLLESTRVLKNKIGLELAKIGQHKKAEHAYHNIQQKF